MQRDDGGPFVQVLLHRLCKKFAGNSEGLSVRMPCVITVILFCFGLFFSAYM